MVGYLLKSNGNMLLEVDIRCSISWGDDEPNDTEIFCNFGREFSAL